MCHIGKAFSHEQMCNFFLSASFYGESYVKFNIAESSSQTTLQFRFFTSRPNGLLFLAAGKESYLFVELHSGNVQVGFWNWHMESNHWSTQSCIIYWVWQWFCKALGRKIRPAGVAIWQYNWGDHLRPHLREGSDVCLPEVSGSGTFYNRLTA